MIVCQDINFPGRVGGWSELEIRPSQSSQAGAGAWTELGKRPSNGKVSLQGPFDLFLDEYLEPLTPMWMKFVSC